MERIYRKDKKGTLGEKDRFDDQRREMSSEGESDCEMVSDKVNLSHGAIEATDEFPKSPSDRRDGQL
jgi:hypothetical protein